MTGKSAAKKAIQVTVTPTKAWKGRAWFWPNQKGERDMTQPEYLLLCTQAKPAKHVVLKSESRPEKRSDGAAIGVSATDFGDLGDPAAGKIDCTYRAIGLAGRVWYLKGAKWRLLTAVFLFVAAVASAVIELAGGLAEHRLPLSVLIVLGLLIVAGLVVNLALKIAKIGKP